ncbi:MAG: BatA domain-containing protein, partial [Myxococcales bacterium]
MGRLVFANPAYLWGLAALSVPILVHLFNRRRPRPLAFGAIEFVLRSQRQKSRRLRLRQILLLAMRCLLVAGVALALARPSLEPKGTAAAVARGPQATALVIDG